MTQPDLMDLLRQKVAELGQSEVARRIGKSPSAVSQVLSGSYKGSPAVILQRIEEVFGQTMVVCPPLGEISMGRCAEIRKRPLVATNPFSVQMWRACQKCERR